MRSRGLWRRILVALSLLTCLVLFGRVIRDQVPILIDSYDPLVISNESDITLQNSLLGPNHLRVDVSNYRNIRNQELSSLLWNSEIIDLDVSGCSNIDNSAFENLGRSRHISVLRANYTKVGPDLGQLLKNMRDIERLQLRRNEFRMFDMDVAQSLNSLRSVDLTESRIARDVIIGIAKLPALERLYLVGATGFTSDDLLTLTTSQSLRELYLGLIEVGHSIVRAVCMMPSVRWIGLSYVSGSSSAELSALQKDFPNITIDFVEQR